MLLDSFDYWDLINLPVFTGKILKNHYIKIIESRKISFHYLELNAEKNILMEIIWIFSIPLSKILMEF